MIQSEANNMKIHIVIFVVLLPLMFVDSALCYKSNTHMAINSIVVSNGFQTLYLQKYLMDNLGYADISKPVNGTPIIKWFENAGKQEDAIPRFLNHFHDPLSNKGFKGLYDPAPLWAQKAVGEQWIGGAYSWQDARNYFYRSLTGVYKADREYNLAGSFRSLGQVMHLVQDMSVPEHTRDTAHPFNFTYETWVEKVASIDKHPYKALFTYLLANPISPDPALLRQAAWLPNATIPITNLFDAQIYTGTNPGLTVGSGIGLAEFSNANFFSFKTIFKDYPYPAPSTIQEYKSIDPVTGKIKTFVRKVRDGEPIEHLAQTIAFYKYLVIKTKGYTLEDDLIYGDYMSKLLPRAVGYSAALLDYFFRGTMSITTAPGDITFRSVKVTASNNTPNEAMGTGDVSLVIRYKALSETGLGGGKYLLSQPSADYTYKVVKLPSVNMASPRELTFDLSSDPLPVHFNDLSMQLVYRGPLGNESDAVAVSPITPLDGVYTDFLLTMPPSGIYAKSSDNTAEAVFNELRVNALTNIPGGLTLPGGKIELALEYRIATSDPFQMLPGNTEPANGYAYVFKIGEKNGVNALAQGVPTELVFDLSSAPLPVKATDVELNIVYTDTATSKALAVGYRDISEATPIDLFNNTDYACISNTWYVAGTSEARAAADLAGNHNGFDDDTDTYHHDFTNIYLKLSPTGNPVKASSTSYNFLEPGPVRSASLQRMGFILTDHTFKTSFLPNWVHVEYPTDGWSRTEAATLDSATAVTLSTGSDGAFLPLPMYNMRGNLMWGNAGVVYDNSKLPANSSCNWNALPPTTTP